MQYLEYDELRSVSIKIALLYINVATFRLHKKQFEFEWERPGLIFVLSSLLHARGLPENLLVSVQYLQRSVLFS